VDEFSDQIGGRLQEAREQAGFTVDDVQFRTRIPRSVIEALEAGNFSVFASPTYAKSFLSQYSGFLKVEAGLWLDALEPASFISGDNVTPLWSTVSPKHEEHAKVQVYSNGWVSALSLFGVTCGVVFAAIKGYEFFDKRLGIEGNSAGSMKEEKIPEPPPRSVAVPALAGSQGEPKPALEKTNDHPAPPTPRAIIVR
jgi:cytoskeletal protein RodZ